jgi:hypothetical protein
LSPTLSASCTILCAKLRFRTISCATARYWALDACAGAVMLDAHTIVAQAQNAIVRSVRPDTLGFRRHLEKVAAALGVASGAVPLRSCEGQLVAQTGP